MSHLNLLGEVDDIPQKYKSITFSFYSKEDEYEKIIRIIKEKVKQLGY